MKMLKIIMEIGGSSFKKCATNAHPQARELAIPLREEFIKRGYIDE